MLKKLSIVTLFSIPFLVNANSWPSSTCLNNSNWLEFSQMNMCLDKKQITSIKVINSELPSMSIVYRGKDYTFLKQTPYNVNGDLHKKYNLSLPEYFSSLVKNESDLELSIPYKVHELKSPSEIVEYNRQGWHVYTLVSNTRSFDEIFIIHSSNEEYIYHVGGEFTTQEATDLISKLNLPEI